MRKSNPLKMAALLSGIVFWMWPQLRGEPSIAWISIAILASLVYYYVGGGIASSIYDSALQNGKLNNAFARVLVLISLAFALAFVAALLAGAIRSAA